MGKMQIKEFNCEIGEEIVRDATAEEIAQIKKDEQESANFKAEADAKAAQRQAVLNRLGITEEEARILLGGN